MTALTGALGSVLGPIASILGSTSPLPWLVPGVLVSMVVGVAAAIPLGRLMNIRPLHAWALIASLGSIAAATLTPLRWTGAPGFEHVPGCDLTRLWPATPGDVAASSDVGLNMVLFVPLGLSIALLPRSRMKTGMVLAAIVLPFAIEIGQSFAGSLGRGCESADIVDNLTGLAFGFAAGWVVSRLAAGPPPSG